MRIWLHLLFILVSCTLAYQLRPIPPESATRAKAQALVDQLYGPGHARVTVTVCPGHGERRVRSTVLGAKGFVVSSQERSERYQRDSQPGDDGNYVQKVRSETVELPREITTRQESDWVERTSVAVVVDRAPGSEVTLLLEAGLGLDRGRGDLLAVVQQAH